MRQNNISQITLNSRKALPLEAKITLSQLRIREFYEKYNNQVYVAFSGGKDSTVLLDIVRSVYPNVPTVFVDTGLEYPEIREFVKTIENVVWIKPDMNFKQVIEKYGYPVISKMQACYLKDYRETKSEKLKDIRWNGRIYNGVKNYKISEKWKFLVNAPFKISDKCCNVIKKKPFHKFEKETGLKPFIGIMASDSIQRKKQYLQQGCNVFSGRIQSRPIAFWTDKDIWEYIHTKNISYSKIYDMGYTRTGCMFCMFGAHLENPNRFQIMKKTHPKQYKFCMEKLGLKKVLEYIGIKYE